MTRSLSIVRRHFGLAIVLVLSGCGDVVRGGPVALGPPGYLEGGTWFMHEANEAPLPVKISERIVGVAAEQTMLDSAMLDVDQNGSWTQRYWFRVLITGTVDRSEMVYDLGSWSYTPSGYQFTSSVRARQFVVTAPLVGQLASVEQMLNYSNAPTVTGTYRLIHP